MTPDLERDLLLISRRVQRESELKTADTVIPIDLSDLQEMVNGINTRLYYLRLALTTTARGLSFERPLLRLRDLGGDIAAETTWLLREIEE